MQCHINLCRKKKINKAECKVNPPLHQPHGLVITERMCTLHVAVFADKFSKCANLIHSQEQQGGLHSPIVFADHTMRGNRNPNIFSPRVQYPPFFVMETGPSFMAIFGAHLFVRRYSSTDARGRREIPNSR